MIISLLEAISGAIIGSFATYILVKFKRVDERLEEMEHVIMDLPTADDIVDKVLHTKIPIGNMPPEVAENIKRQAMAQIQAQMQAQQEKSPPPLKKADSYFG
jgi:hypothetical protein